MHTPSPLSRLLPRWSKPTWWLLGLLALSASGFSAGHLLVIAGVQLPGVLADWHDAGERFVRDTIRLTFKTDKKPVNTDSVVFAAPLGVLDPKQTFVWVEALPAPSAAPGPAGAAASLIVAAPQRLLDPQWEPPFKKEP